MAEIVAHPTLLDGIRQHLLATNERALVAKGNFLVIKKYILKYVLESKIITIPLLYHNYFTP
jgi:hypothetical protein